MILHFLFAVKGKVIVRLIWCRVDDTRGAHVLFAWRGGVALGRGCGLAIPYNFSPRLRISAVSSGFAFSG